MQLKMIVTLTLGLSTAMMMSAQASQPAPSAGATQDMSSSSSRVLQRPEAPLRVRPKKAGAPNLVPVPGQYPRPVITDPVSGYVCCSNYVAANVTRVSTEFDVHGTGSPGHLVRVMVDLDNGGSKSSIKNERVTVGADGRWRLRWVKVSSRNMNTSTGFIEINATEYFPATEVRQPDGEAYAKPVVLRYEAPRGPSMEAGSSGG